jgi:RNA polymerase sigma-70 factor (family 1)
MIKKEKNTLELLKTGNVNAFEEVFQEYFGRVLHFISSLIRDWDEANSLTQEVFIILWENREKLDDNTVYGPYLYKIARNLALNSIRKKINERIYLDYLTSRRPDHDYSTLNEIQHSELESLTQKLINKLPGRRKEIFLLSYERGYTYKEIAKQLQITENTVDTQIRNALDFLRTEILKVYFSMLIVSMILLIS